MIFMLAGNICLRYVPANRVLGGCVILFGVFCTALGGAGNYSTVLAMRVLVGAAQAFIQGLALYLTLWYKRHEIATRAGKCIS